MNDVLKGASFRLMTYAEIEAETGLKPASARQLVRRNEWRRVPGNDGRARIEVPVDELERYIKRGDEAPVDDDETDGDAPLESPVDSPFEAPLVTALTGHIERLERALADATTALSEREGERDEARLTVQAAREDVLVARGQIEVLRVQLGAERERTEAATRRADDVAADRDRWHEAATRAPAPHVPWWRRLAG